MISAKVRGAWPGVFTEGTADFMHKVREFCVWKTGGHWKQMGGDKDERYENRKRCHKTGTLAKEKSPQAALKNKKATGELN